ncbi:MAG: hypothetical protein HAW67_00705 [Endozoicomonadaceae bacterium]|nr:hypothetical protein [Endozoicomonadaceae bacterium]
MRFIFLLPLSLSLLACSQLPRMEYSTDGRFGGKCDEFCSVTVAQLVITPERFHGKEVQVFGLLSVTFEGYGVTSGEHRIWINLTEDQKKEYRNLDGIEGFVRGIYDGTDSGHFGLYGGAIHTINRFGD